MASGAAGEGDALGDKNNGQASNNNVSPYFQIGTNDGANLSNTQQKAGQGIMSQQALNQRGSSAHSPMNALD